MKSRKQRSTVAGHDPAGRGKPTGDEFDCPDLSTCMQTRDQIQGQKNRHARPVRKQLRHRIGGRDARLLHASKSPRNNRSLLRNTLPKPFLAGAFLRAGSLPPGSDWEKSLQTFGDGSTKVSRRTDPNQKFDHPIFASRCWWNPCIRDRAFIARKRRHDPVKHFSWRLNASQ